MEVTALSLLVGPGAACVYGFLCVGIGGNGGVFSLAQLLQDCTVQILDWVGKVLISDCTGCQILIGSVCGFSVASYPHSLLRFVGVRF